MFLCHKFQFVHPGGFYWQVKMWPLALHYRVVSELRLNIQEKLLVHWNHIAHVRNIYLHLYYVCAVAQQKKCWLFTTNFLVCCTACSIKLGYLIINTLEWYIHYWKFIIQFFFFIQLTLSIMCPWCVVIRIFICTTLPTWTILLLCCFCFSFSPLCSSTFSSG